MRRKAGVWTLVALCAAAAFAEKQPFDRYQSIIDRMPFGQPPPGFDPTKSPDEVSKSDYAAAGPELTQEQEAIQKSVQFSVINVEADGSVRVGFSDLSDPKAPRHYYMAAGETRGGWTVKAADPVEKSMTVVKDEVEVELRLGENSGGDAKGGGAGAKGRASGATPRAGTTPRSPLLASPSATGGTSLRSRRERREAEEAAARKEAADREAERRREAEERAARAEEEKAQREADRAEQREQLKALQEELRKTREELKRDESDEKGKDGDGEDGDGEA